MFLVVEKFAFVADPFFIQSVEISIFEGRIEFGWRKTVDFTFSVELIVQPISLVSEFSIGVKKFSEAVHLILFPLSLIEASFWKETSPQSFPIPFNQIALKLAFELSQL